YAATEIALCSVFIVPARNDCAHLLTSLYIRYPTGRYTASVLDRYMSPPLWHHVTRSCVLWIHLFVHILVVPQQNIEVSGEHVFVVNFATRTGDPLKRS